MSVIATSDITDSLVNDFGATIVGAKITANDDAFTDLIEQHNVESADVEDTPYHYLIKRWAIAWVGREICFDYMGKNNVEIADIEKYRIKYEEYKELVADYETKITPKVLTGNVEAIRDRATSRTGILFRN